MESIARARGPSSYRCLMVREKPRRAAQTNRLCPRVVWELVAIAMAKQFHKRPVTQPAHGFPVASFRQLGYSRHCVRSSPDLPSRSAAPTAGGSIVSGCSVTSGDAGVDVGGDLVLGPADRLRPQLHRLAN
jgi:hypothetical protein